MQQRPVQAKTDTPRAATSLVVAFKYLSNFLRKVLKNNVTLPTDFDSQTYLELNPDVREAGVDAIEHYLRYGVIEGRAYKRRGKDFEDTLAEFLTESAVDQNAFELFSKSWTTYFDGVRTGGTSPLGNDARIKWLLDRVNLADKSVLELGPLEAGHTCMLEKAGAKVLAIEANKGAFLRCLIVKNHFGLRSKFLLGDFEKTEFSGENYDLVMASGVLYHMREPVAFLEKFGNLTDKLFIWTHYFEPNLSRWNENLRHQIDSGKWDIGNPIVVSVGHLKIRTIRQHYKESLGWSGFCGGTDTYSSWIYREDLLSLLDFLGFKKIEISFDEVGHQNGPSFCVLAQK
jgi:hypothetical protein